MKTLPKTCADVFSRLARPIAASPVPRFTSRFEVMAEHGDSRRTATTSKTNSGKRVISLLTILFLAGVACASERLSIERARLLPDYAKSMLLPWTSAGEDRVPWGGIFMVADLNKDGRPDIVQTEGPLPRQSPGDLDLGVFLQNSDGELIKQPRVPIRTTCPLDIFAADLNGDSHLDLLANDAGNDMILALGNGDGTFQEPHFLGLAVSYYPTVGDLDGDANLDLAAASGSGAVLVFFGRGDGTFRYGTNLAAAISPRNGCNSAAGATMIRDVNSDRRLDIVVASPEDSFTFVGSLHVFPGNGDGTFGNRTTTTNVGGWRGELGDFNGDGFLDYAGDRYNPVELEIWLGLGNGHFAKAGTHSLSGMDPVGVNIFDLNGDGIPDVTVCGEPPNGCCQTPLSVFLGKGDGTFRPRQTFIAADGLLPLNVAPTVVDFNRDGLRDLLTRAWNTNGSGITIAANRGQTPNLNAGFQLTVHTDTNAAIVLERTTDLINWTALATNAAPRGTWPLVDTAQAPHRFYRTRRP